MSRVLYLLPLIVLLSGCPNFDKGQGYPAWVAQELSNLKSDVTLGQWKKSHPTETVVLYSPTARTGINIDTTWCAKTEASTNLPDGEGAVRHAVFYPPIAPASLALPSDADENLIDNQCTLGLVWIDQNELSERRGNKIALNIRKALNQVFGQGQSDILLNRIDKKYLSQTGRWKVGEAVFISAYKNFPPTGKVVMALGYLPSSGFYGDGEQFRMPYYETSRETQIQRIREALKIADNLPQDGEVLLSYFPPSGGTPVLQPDNADLLVRLLEKWVSASDKLDRTRKAGALVVADQVLDQMQFQIGTSNIEKGGSYRQRLEKLGAKFFKSQLESAYIYAHSWLEAARSLDSEGPMGDLAFRLLLEMGCSKYGKIDFQSVIKQGEEYLKNNHEVMNTAEVQLMVAEAYRDIVALSLGAGEGNEHPEAYKDEAIAAREKALMLYKKALPLLKTSTLTQGAWREAWRLYVGLPPAELRYYCIYD